MLSAIPLARSIRFKSTGREKPSILQEILTERDQPIDSIANKTEKDKPIENTANKKVDNHDHYSEKADRYDIAKVIEAIATLRRD